MKINEGFELIVIGDVPYVLPFGQNIADHKKGFSLNESGLILWKGISEGLSRTELVEKLAQFYEADYEERKLLENDVEEFLEKLEFYGILNEKMCDQRSKEHFFTIGNIRVRIEASEEFISDTFKDFEISESDAVDLTITIKTGHPSVTENGQLIIRNHELCVLKKSDKYIFLFPEAKQIVEGHLSADGKTGCFYVRMPYSTQLREDIYHAIRLMYLYKAQLEDMYVVHSASILYKGKTWLFSASSGVGKSTHTKMWNDVYDTPLINGDLNMLAIENNNPVVHGIPWCGTSGIYDNKTYPLGGIIFLKRGDSNACEELKPDEKALHLMQRMISPTWSSEMINKNIRFAEKIAELVPVCRLRCTKDYGAVEVIKKWIDECEKH